MGKALGIVFHWRGECITPHGEENTGSFLLAEASKDQAQNPFFPKLKMCAVHLAQTYRAWIACQWLRSCSGTMMDNDSLKTHVHGWLMCHFRV